MLGDFTCNCGHFQTLAIFCGGRFLHCWAISFVGEEVHDQGSDFWHMHGRLQEDRILIFPARASLFAKGLKFLGLIQISKKTRLLVKVNSIHSRAERWSLSGFRSLFLSGFVSLGSSCFHHPPLHHPIYRLKIGEISVESMIGHLVRQK